MTTLNTQLDTITVAIDGDSVTYFIAQTTAPKAYDGFGTITVYESAYSYNPDTEGETVRVVLIREEHFNWQKGRYNSGLFYATNYGNKERVAELLWERIAGGKQ